MAAVSVIKKLQRCERIGRDDYHTRTVNVQYKIKIKDCACSPSSSPAAVAPPLPLQQAALLTTSTLPYGKVLNERTDSFSHVLTPDNHKKQPPLSSRERAIISAFARSPLDLLKTDNLLQELAEDYEDEDLTFWLQPSSADFTATVESSEGSNLQKLMGLDSKQEEVLGSLEVRISKKKEAAEEKSMLQRETHKEPTALKRSVDESKFPWKLDSKQKTNKKEGQEKYWEVKRLECECCKMEEECSKGYEETVRAELCGHWLCGLCKEAVREEQQRLGGRAGGVSLELALKAHMQPCNSFSSRAHAKVTPPPSDVAVPHAVCRLLRRHLSSPARSPRLSPSSSSGSLPRSASCLSSFRDS